jgi:hypothetical protein
MGTRSNNERTPNTAIVVAPLDARAKASPHNFLAELNDQRDGQLQLVKGTWLRRFR